MNKTSIRYSILAVLLAASLTGCGNDDDVAGDMGQSQDENAPQKVPANRPVPPADAGQDEEEVGTAHVTLTGALATDADYQSVCDIFSNKGLQISMDKPGERAPQVQVRIDDYMNPGKYNAFVVVRTHPQTGPVQEWAGEAQVQVQKRAIQKVAGPDAGTAYSGTFQGTYAGAGGTGNVSGRFDHCFMNKISN